MGVGGIVIERPPRQGFVKNAIHHGETLLSRGERLNPRVRQIPNDPRVTKGLGVRIRFSANRKKRLAIEKSEAQKEKVTKTRGSDKLVAFIV